MSKEVRVGPSGIISSGERSKTKPERDLPDSGLCQGQMPVSFADLEAAVLDREMRKEFLALLLTRKGNDNWQREVISLLSRWAKKIALRLTLVDDDGTLLADSAFEVRKGEELDVEATTRELKAADNHNTRPEILRAKLCPAVGFCNRYSRTLGDKFPSSYAAARIPVDVPAKMVATQCVLRASRPAKDD